MIEMTYTKLKINTFNKMCKNIFWENIMSKKTIQTQGTQNICMLRLR